MTVCSDWVCISTRARGASYGVGSISVSTMIDQSRYGYLLVNPKVVVCTDLHWRFGIVIVKCPIFGSWFFLEGLEMKFGLLMVLGMFVQYLDRTRVLVL